MIKSLIFDRYYCIDSAKTKEITVHYILQHHVFIIVKVFILMLVLLIISTCFAWRPVTSLNGRSSLNNEKDHHYFLNRFVCVGEFFHG